MRLEGRQRCPALEIACLSALSFVIKEIEAGRLKCRLINRHRRIEFEELMRYKDEQKQRSSGALKQLNDLSQEMGEEL
jgi:hypothetical protein